MKKILTVAAMLGGSLLLTYNPALAQTQTASDQDVRLLRKDLRSLKKQIVAANIELTDAEALQFWPIYDRYSSELSTIMDRKFDLLSDYMRNYDTITDEQADAYLQGRAAVEDSLMQLRLKYIPIFRKVLSGRTTALFFQIDWRFGLVMDLQLSSQTPTVEQ